MRLNFVKKNLKFGTDVDFEDHIRDGNSNDKEFYNLL